MSTRPTADTALAWTLFVVAAVTALYWIVWYLVPGGEQELAVLPNDEAHARFEDAFLLADTWMAFAAMMAGVGLLRSSPRMIGWLYMAGSAGIYLAAMDVLYDVQNGIYQMVAIPERREAVLTEIIVNVGTVAFSAWAIARARRSL